MSTLRQAQEPKPLDINLLLSTGAIEGPCRKPHPWRRSFWGRFFGELRAFLFNSKGPFQ